MTFSQIILERESLIRLSVFLAVFAIVAAVEVMAPRRPLTVTRARRWLINISVIMVNGLVVRLTFPVLATAVAAMAAQRGWGLFNLASLPFWVEVMAAVIALDLVIYAQHVVFHYVPVLWRFHQMHHVDLDIDVTTGARFHPIEIVLSMLIKFAAVIILGAPAVAVVIFEVLLNGSAMFNHGNFRLPAGIDGALRRVMVTPDMHRVHHSTIPREFNSNFGFALSWWDRLFATYRAQPKAGHLGMTIGQPGFRDPGRLGLIAILALPFRRRPAPDPETAA